MKRYLLLILSIFFISTSVYALDDISIDNIEVVDKSDDVIINDNNSFNLTFNNIGETVRYKLNIKNSTNYTYYIDCNPKYDFINIKFRNKKLKRKSNNDIYVDITYNKLVDTNQNYQITDLIKVKLSKNML